MKNRDKVLNRLQDVSKGMESELQYYLEIEREGEYDKADAFYDLWEQVEMYKSEERKLWTEIKDIVVDVGFCVPYDESMIIVTTHGKPWDFMHKGQKYMIDSSWKVWIEK